MLCINVLFCDEFCAPSQKLLERHFKFVHSNDPGFSIHCSTCHRKYTNYCTYQNHLLKHKKEINNTVTELSIGNESTDESRSTTDENFHDYDIPNSNSEV